MSAIHPTCRRSEGCKEARIVSALGWLPTFTVPDMDVSDAQIAAGAKLRTGVVLRGVTGPEPPSARIRPNDWSQPQTRH